MMQHPTIESPSGFLCLCLLCILTPPSTFANEIIVTVREPFLDMRTGPGRGFPVFHVVEQDEEIEIVTRRTDWFRVRTRDQQTKTGWVHHSQMTRTVNTEGAHITFANSTLEDAIDRHWESALLNTFYLKDSP